MNYIGIDLGGTNLRIARFDASMNIETQVSIPTEKEKGINQIIDKICNGINDIKTENTIGVGVAVPGQVDLNTGVVIYATNLSFENTPLGEEIWNRCSLKVILNNDANAAGLGEAVSGSASDVNMSYYITWSTGIGGALIIDKNLINGNNICTGEVGYTIADPSYEKQYNEKLPKGATEALASGTAIYNFAKENGYNNAKGLFDAYKNNDLKAIEFVDLITDVFARLLHNVVHVIEVEKFVIGGGVTINSGDILIPIVKEKFEKNLVPPLKGKVEITTAKLGDDAGIIGAAFLAKTSIN